MNLTDLNHDERLALLGLLEIAVLSDRDVSGPERARVDEIVADLGEDVYRALLDEAEERFTSREALISFLATIDRQEAREVIYGAVSHVAISDAANPLEADMLEWLAAEWSISVSYGDDS